MPMATTQEVGPYPAAHTGCLETQVFYSGLRALCSQSGVGERVQICSLPTLQPALPAVGKSSHPAGLPALGGLSWFALGISPLLPALSSIFRLG